VAGRTPCLRYAILEDMNSDLNSLASLEFGKRMEALNREKTKEFQRAAAENAARGMSQSSFLHFKKTEIEIEFAHRALKALSDIWVDLLEGTNGGVLTRQHVDFIKSQIAGAAGARRGALMNQPSAISRPNEAAIARNVAMSIDRIQSDVWRDLEIRLRRRSLGLSTEGVMKNDLNLTINQAGNVNFGVQMGEITATANAISEQGPAQTEVATAFKSLAEAVETSTSIQDSQKQEILEAIFSLAEQARLKPEERRMGTVKTIFIGMATMLGVSADLTTIWTTYGQAIRAFFHF
jgi:hypothetical protein